MFKRHLTLLLTVFTALASVLLAGCAKSDADMKADVTLEELASEIMEADENFGTLFPLEAEYYTSVYGGGTDIMEEYALYEGMNISSVRIFLAKAKTEADVEQIEKDFEAARQKVEDIFSTYLPAPYEMAKQGRVITKGLYVMMVIGEDTDQAQEIFEGHIS